MTNHPQTDTHVGELLSGYIDGELTQQDRQRVSLHCENCPQCRASLAELQSMRDALGDAQLSDISKDIWRENMHDSTVRASRSLGWLLFIGGALIAAGFGLYEVAKAFDSIPTIAKLMMGGIYGGLLLLFVSVLRQRMVERKTDKYKDVEI